MFAVCIQYISTFSTTVQEYNRALVIICSQFHLLLTDKLVNYQVYYRNTYVLGCQSSAKPACYNTVLTIPCSIFLLETCQLIRSIATNSSHLHRQHVFAYRKRPTDRPFPIYLTDLHLLGIPASSVFLLQKTLPCL